MGKFGKDPLPKFLLKKLGNNVKDTSESEEPTEDLEKAEDRKHNRDEKGYVFESFQEFEQNAEEEEVNEDDMIGEPVEMAQPCEGCSETADMLSEKAKAAIKQVCETVLIQEAHVFETSEDPNQTYESFLRECTHYLAECLIRASQNLKV